MEGKYPASLIILTITGIARADNVAIKTIYWQIKGKMRIVPPM
jgi:hypothetical protein